MGTTPSLPTEDQRRKDAEHVKLLSVFHFVLGGLAFCGIAFLFLHFFLIRWVVSHPDIWKSKDGTVFPVKELFAIFRWVYLFMGVLLAVEGIANILSGIFLRQRKHRMFSIVVAGLNCLQIPFGTVLGAFTIVVLVRDSVRQSYERLTHPSV